MSAAKKAPAKGAQPKAAAKSAAKSAAKKAPPPPRPARKEGLDPLRIIHADFLAGAAPGSSLPAPVSAEIAFAGRSNVGKSSLINTLVERKSLVRTGSTPGLTRQLNLYEARAADATVFHLVDLPGYGFAKRSKAETKAWGTLIEGYLTTRATLAAVVLIVDVRRGLEDDDRELIEFIEATAHPSRRPVQILVVATKLDKVPKSQRKSLLRKIEESAGRRVIGFSAVDAEGRPELWRALRRAALGDAALASSSAPAADVADTPVSPEATSDEID